MEQRAQSHARMSSVESRQKSTKGQLDNRAWGLSAPPFTLNINTMTKKETIKFIVQIIASVATAILTALGATSCVGA